MTQARKNFSNILKTGKNKRGFSILELVIAMFVLTVGIVGALNLIVSTMNNSINTRKAVVAAGLAQEGVELARNIRDNNLLLAKSDISRSREDFFKNGFSVGDGNCIFNYDFDYNADYPFPTNCTNANVANRILYITGAGFYTHDPTGNTETVFRRYVRFEYDNDNTDTFLNLPPAGVFVTSYVWWGGDDDHPAQCRLSTNCIEIRDYLPKRD